VKNNLSIQCRLSDINAMDRDTFVAAFGGVFEDSPWVAETAWQSVPFESIDDLVETLCDVVRRAGRGRQLALLRVHPELGVRKPLTGHSEREQRNAGLKGGEGGQADLLADLNRRYRDKFGFPFILAVKGLGPDEILMRFRERLENRPEDEFNECLEQVFRIAGFRLEELLNGFSSGRTV
jgi:2-oxo-4-hydroxy-4-carboxy-5-ureidoimidazoline decarboxylase